MVLPEGSRLGNSEADASEGLKQGGDEHHTLPPVGIRMRPVHRYQAKDKQEEGVSWNSKALYTRDGNGR